MDSTPDLDIRRLAVRRRALANSTLLLLEAARRTAGRLAVLPYGQDALALAYRDVRTLVRKDGFFAVEARDITVMLLCPPLWPLDREAPLVPIILAPDDFAHANSNGRALCLDLQGVEPERLPGLLYDNLRLAHARLDHAVDWRTSDFIRAHPELVPTDTRPLLPAEGMP